jgi:hypothetical protein
MDANSTTAGITRIATGVLALEGFATETRREELSGMTNDRLLLLRSVESLVGRLRAGLARPAVLGPAMLSPADFRALTDVAAAHPRDREALNALREELEKFYTQP